ncbi:hypothetical protein C8J57DRAFT_1396957 [Mycena rebaudengoi]|nr:hypothetical protein C8J57DRAFT_1396957 [Mycena rebaudengoi]
MIAGSIAAVAFVFTLVGMIARQVHKHQMPREALVGGDPEAFSNAISLKTVTPHPQSETAHLLASESGPTQ